MEEGLTRLTINQMTELIEVDISMYQSVLLEEEKWRMLQTKFHKWGILFMW